VRFALVARSSNFETRIDGTGQRVRDVVTGVAPTWTGGTGTFTATIVLSKNPDGSANPDWQAYRYRTFENLAPTRNVVWMGAQAGC
jgi:type IV pilus assembly protein PilW